VAEDTKSKSEPPKPSKPAPAATRAEWGVPFARFDAWWTRVEAKLCAALVFVEIAALCLWVVLKGMSRDYSGTENKAGLVLRLLVTAAALGAVWNVVGRVNAARADKAPRWGRVALVAVPSLLLAYIALRSWSHTSVTYASNLLNWMQNASVLMMFGGLRGFVTRMTLWLALLGASIATSKGKHINVDVVVRMMKPETRTRVAALTWTVAALVCLGAALGFSDYIMIADFRLNAERPCAEGSSAVCQVPASEKVAAVLHDAGNDAFLLGRQASLDVRSFPRVLAGDSYDKWMTAAEWNDWLGGADWKAHFPEGAVDALKLNADDTKLRRTPAVNVPGGSEQALGLLLREFNFILPFGMLMIGLRFLLRVVLLLAGYVTADPDAVHGDDDLKHAGHDDEEDGPSPPPAGGGLHQAGGAA
jgi:TRAP-type C4-dicarboxylate transport system permease small subunit